MIKLACCGDDCNYCPRYTGTINNDEEALRRAAEIWYEIGWRDRILPPDEMKCYGCLSVKNCAYGIKGCCRKKKIDNCGYCVEMPCERLKEAVRRVKKFEKISKDLMSEEEYEIFKMAFWLKEKRLKRIRDEKKSDNKTPHRSSEYDIKVRKTIPFYECFQRETIDLVKTINPDVRKWLDTGCGTGYLIEKAITELGGCKFVLTDPSAEMLAEAGKRLKSYKNIEYMEPVKTEEINISDPKGYDVITAIQVHHYLNEEDRKKATLNCYKLLKDNGIYVVFENIRSENDGALDFQLDRWMNFQLREGKSKKGVSDHRKRFGVKYFPIKVSEHLKLLNTVGFRIVEILWLSYLQAGFFCIK